MMHSANFRSPMQFPLEDTSLLRRQLQREITCLEMQLDRLYRLNELLDHITVQTYEDMIAARKEMLESL